MEEGIFHRPAVAAALERDYVEARLHCDAEPPIEANNKLEMEWSGVQARPTFVIYDPATGQKLGRKRGVISEDKFVEFLNGKK